MSDFDSNRRSKIAISGAPCARSWPTAAYQVEIFNIAVRREAERQLVTPGGHYELITLAKADDVSHKRDRLKVRNASSNRDPGFL